MLETTLPQQGRRLWSVHPSAEFQENSAVPQPIKTAIVTHGVKNHKHLGTAIPLLASLLFNLRKKLWNVEDQRDKCHTEGQQQPYTVSNRHCIYKKRTLPIHSIIQLLIYLTIEFYYFNQFLEVLIRLLWLFKQLKLVLDDF
jgi:hypothetical protein